MADDSPTMRRRQLGAELRRLREEAGKTQEDVAQWTNVPATTISRMEKGKRRVTVTFLKAVLPLYHVGSPQAEALEKLARESSERGWWAAYGDTVPDWFASYLGMETAADELWTYEAEYVPGILQTHRYTEATLAAMGTSSEGSEKLVAVRSARQKRLSGDNPMTLRAVLNEAVVRRQVGGPDVMREQLEYLAEAAARPNITLQVLPFAAGAHPGMLGPFTALRFPQEPLNTIYIELDGGAIYWEKPASVERYAATFRRLTDLALNEEDTISLISEALRGGEN